MMHSLQGFQSHLFKSMHSYLCNQNRVQPIIGLSSVIELCTDTKPPVYLCEACVLRVNVTDIKTHIMGSLHRYNYIKLCHTNETGTITDLAPQAWHLFELAKLIEKKEGTGHVQVLHLHEDIYKEMMSKPVLDVLAKVKQINSQSNITELQFPLCRTVTKDDYYNYYGILDQATPSYTTALSLMSYATGFSRIKEIQNPFKTQSPVQCGLPTQILCLDRDNTAQSPARTEIQVRTPSSPGYPLPNCIPSISPTTAFSSVPAAVAFQIENPIEHAMQNVTVHKDKTVKNWGNGINTFECLSIESPSSKTVQTTKPKYNPKRVAQWQNNSLTVTITQKPNPVHIKGQKSTHGHLTTLKLMSTEAHTPAIIWNEDQCQINDYLTSEEPFRDTNWVLHNRNVGQEDWQHPQPFTADDTLCMYESMGQYQQLQEHLEEHTVPLTKHSEESPENYSGTQPLIGLHAVIKCQSVSGDPPPCCYLCQPCSLKVLKSDIIQHLISPLHKINYINFQYPHLSQCHSAIQSLETTAMLLEQEEGRGQMEVRRLSACLFNEVQEQDFHWSMKILNCGWNEERRLNPNATMKRCRMTPERNVSLKRSAGFAGITVDCDENGATGKPPLSCKRVKKERVAKARFSPVFKVSFLLSEGPMIVDRIPLVTATVAPETD